MAKRISILLAVMWVLMGVLAVRSLSQPFEPRPRFKQGMTAEEYGKQIEEWGARRQQQKREKNWKYSEGVDFVRMELRKKTLGVTEQQWKLIEPKYHRVQAFLHNARLQVGTSHRRISGVWSFHWYKFSQDNYYRRGRAFEKLSEGEKIAEELIDLLADKNSKDEAIRLKINALQQARENARKELPKARQELRSLLTPRQQAILQLWETLD